MVAADVAAAMSAADGRPASQAIIFASNGARSWSVMAGGGGAGGSTSRIRTWTGTELVTVGRGLLIGPAMSAAGAGAADLLVTTAGRADRMGRRSVGPKMADAAASRSSKCLVVRILFAQRRTTLRAVKLARCRSRASVPASGQAVGRWRPIGCWRRVLDDRRWIYFHDRWRQA